MTKLTREQIAAMTADELRLAVAEYVMGWKWRNNIRMKKIGYLVSPEHKEVDRYGAINDNGKITFVALPDYPGDISAAWQVIEEMNRKKYWCQTQTPFFEGQLNYAGFTPHYTSGWNGTPDNWTGDATMPLAICRAALMAVMSEME